MNKKEALLNDIQTSLNDLQWEIKHQLNTGIDPLTICAEVRSKLKHLATNTEVEEVKLAVGSARLSGMDEEQFQACMTTKVSMFMSGNRVSSEVLDEKRRVMETIRSRCPEIDDVKWDEGVARQTIRRLSRSQFFKYIKLQKGVYYRNTDLIEDNHEEGKVTSILSTEPKSRRVLVRAMECIYQELQKYAQ